MIGRDLVTLTGLRVEPLAVAVGAEDRVHVAFELPDLHPALAVAILLEQIRNNAGETCRRTSSGRGRHAR